MYLYHFHVSDSMDFPYFTSTKQIMLLLASVCPDVCMSLNTITHNVFLSEWSSYNVLLGSSGHSNQQQGIVGIARGIPSTEYFNFSFDVVIWQIAILLLLLVLFLWSLYSGDTTSQYLWMTLTYFGDIDIRLPRRLLYSYSDVIVQSYCSECC